MTLEVQHLTKRYGESLVLNDVSFQSKPAEFIAIIGPSGCGKTTLLRLIAGLETADAGSVFVNQTSVDTLPSRERNVSMVFQGESLYMHMTVRKNLEFPLTVRRVAKSVMDTAVDRVAEQVGVGELLDRDPATLSGGQRQRVALGRALVREPSVCLLDEPFSHLDAHVRRQFVDELQALKQSSAATLFVTHDLREAIQLGDRVAVMCDGKIHQFDTPNQIRQHPATDFVASFMCG